MPRLHKGCCADNDGRGAAGSLEGVGVFLVGIAAAVIEIAVAASGDVLTPREAVDSGSEVRVLPAFVWNSGNAGANHQRAGIDKVRGCAVQSMKSTGRGPRIEIEVAIAGCFHNENTPVSYTHLTLP